VWRRPATIEPRPLQILRSHFCRDLTKTARKGARSSIDARRDLQSQSRASSSKSNSSRLDGRASIANSVFPCSAIHRVHTLPPARRVRTRSNTEPGSITPDRDQSSSRHREKPSAQHRRPRGQCAPGPCQVIFDVRASGPLRAKRRRRDGRAPTCQGYPTLCQSAL